MLMGQEIIIEHLMGTQHCARRKMSKLLCLWKIHKVINTEFSCKVK